ncbi:MAG: globin domain-containing protein [Bacteroidota bacterium]
MPPQENLSPKQVLMIEKSWGKILAYAEQIGDIFYEELFQRAPELQSLFQDSHQERSRKLMYAIMLMATKLKKLENIEEDIKGLSSRHVGYGVQAEHFYDFGKAFLLGLEKVMGEEWNPDYEDAWYALYRIISRAMAQEIEKKRKSQKARDPQS